MRVMVIVKANKDSENGVLPTDGELAEMLKFNEQLVKAGIMLAGDGLHPSKRGVRIEFPSKEVTDGPFTETKELIAGYWIWQVKTIEEATEWAKRAPCFGAGGQLELRPVFEVDEFDMSHETREGYEKQSAELSRKH
jgi:hypothetical protein